MRLALVIVVALVFVAVASAATRPDSAFAHLLKTGFNKNTKGFRVTKITCEKLDSTSDGCVFEAVRLADHKAACALVDVGKQPPHEIYAESGIPCSQYAKSAAAMRPSGLVE